MIVTGVVMRRIVLDVRFRNGVSGSVHNGSSKPQYQGKLFKRKEAITAKIRLDLVNLELVERILEFGRS